MALALRLCQALLAARADAALADANGSTPLHWASKAGSHETVAAGAEPEEP